MDILGIVTSALVVFTTLVANAFTKIMLMLLGVIIAFLAIPQSRAAAMFGIAVISAFAGGILIESHSVHKHWSDAFELSLAFGCGFLVYPFLSYFKKFNELVSQDKEIVELVFATFKKLLNRLLKQTP